MRRLAVFSIGFVLGTGCMFAAYQWHVVRGPQNWMWITKKQPSLSGIYVDIRQWGAQDWASHPELARDLTAAGHGELILEESARGFLGEMGAPLSSDSPHRPAPGREHR